jgi:hypothetical protein
MFKFCDWITPKKLDWTEISQNPNVSIEILEKHHKKLDWRWITLNYNPVVFHFILKHQDKVDKARGWDFLSGNPSYAVIQYLKKHPEKINWNMLSQNTNPDAIAILEQNLDHINWSNLERNPAPAAIALMKKQPQHNEKHYWFNLARNCTPEAIDIQAANLDKIDWWILSQNHAAADLLLSNIDKLVWSNLCYNTNPKIIALLAENIERINWDNLSANRAPEAIAIIEKNLHRLKDWDRLSQNPTAIHLLEKNATAIHPTKPKIISHTRTGIYTYIPPLLDWTNVSRNPAAAELLKRHKENINWHFISSNSFIFDYNYAGMRAARRALHNELIAAALHPDRVAAFLAAGGDLNDF